MAGTTSYGSKWEDDLRGSHSDPNVKDSLRVGMHVKVKDSGREGMIDIPLASRVNGWLYTVRFPSGQTEKYPQSALRVGYRQDARSPSPGYTTVAAAAANIMKICDTFLANGEVPPCAETVLTATVTAPPHSPASHVPCRRTLITDYPSVESVRVTPCRYNARLRKHRAVARVPRKSSHSAAHG